MFRVLLYMRGGNPHENVVDEMALEVVPVIGDRLQVQRSTHSDPAAYEVVSRTFHQDHHQGRPSGVTRIFVEVVPAQAVLGNPSPSRGGRDELRRR